LNRETDINLIKRLSCIPYTGAISDILDESGYPNQVLPSTIRPLAAGQTIAGRALTILGESTTETNPDVIFPPILNMLGEIREGDVLVYQANSSECGHLGELSSETAKFRGARGAVIDGGARDTDYIIRLGFPVFCRYRSPRDIGGRWQMVRHSVPITIGAVTVTPGDFVVGDADGVLVIPSGIAEGVIRKAEEVVATENMVRKAILQGEHPAKAFERFGRF
jgi:regulator of RNase E activity RraA